LIQDANSSPCVVENDLEKVGHGSLGLRALERVTIPMLKILRTVGGLILLMILGTVVNIQAQAAVPEPISFGSATAKIKVVVYIDFQCPSCADFYPHLVEVEKKYPNLVLISFRHFPLPMHDKAYIAAQAVEAANVQGKGLEMMNILLTNQRHWSVDPKTKIFGGYARKLGLDLEKYRADFESKETKGRIDRDMKLGRSISINSVPTVFLNDKKLTYPESMEIAEIISKEIS
jgi:protein-disulfide isomerase